MSQVITIDGPAGSGKSTVSRLLAGKLKYFYLDTGAMYRAVALAATRKGIDLEDGKRLEVLCRSLDLCFVTDADSPRLMLDGEDISMAIRDPEMDILSSTVSAVREVREAMTALQRKMAKGVNIVAEGRDMGTVVFPEAQYKFFLTASEKIKAERRYRERQERGEIVTKELVEEGLKKRDHQDRTRSLAPLKPARGTEVIDSTRLKVEEVVEKILRHIKGK